MICPYCRRPLPNPDERFCTSCGGDLHVAPPIPADVSGLSAAPPPPGGGWSSPEHRGGTPWEQRDQLGFATAFLETTKGVLSAPAEFFRNMPTSGGMGSPLFYGVLTGFIGLLANSVYRLVMHLISGGATAITGDTPAEKAMAMFQGGFGIGQFLLQVFLGPLLLPVALFITAGIYHLVLMLLGGANKDYEATLRVCCYSQATALFQIVPFCGAFVTIVWNLVCNAIGLSEAHGISRGKGAAAVLLPLVLCCCCVAVFVFLMAGSIASLANR